MSNYVNLLDIIYPVGSVYITFSDVSPVNSVGGSWEKIDGKFLQSSSTTEKNNSTGGFSGNIGFNILYGAWYGSIVPTRAGNTDDSVLSLSTSSPSHSFTNDIVKYNQILTKTQTNYSKNAGIKDDISINTVPHPDLYTKELYWDTRPAYITCNMWKRIA